MISYEDAGVSVERGDQFVESIKKKVHRTYNKRVASGVGGFACLYEMGDKYLAAGTDGVGTKLKLAQQLNLHNTIGIDLVAMCVNDIICTGASPQFFMDYLATGKLETNTAESILDGVIKGCEASKMALIGGETAEMPGMYSNGEYDLAGFAVGEVTKDQVIDGTTIKPDQTLVGLASSGFHSNGYSLLRKLFKSDETNNLQDLLFPTRIYTNVIGEILEEHRESIHGLAHITGGGIQNIARINSSYDYEITNWMDLKTLPFYHLLKEVQIRSELDQSSLLDTFNMGVGFVLVTSKPEQVINCAKRYNDLSPTILGTTKFGSGKIVNELSDIL